MLKHPLRKIKGGNGMYPEFIPIYVGLVVIIILLMINLIVMIKRTSGRNIASKKNMSYNIAAGGGNIVFCKSCATQYDASQHCCPRCGTAR